MTQWVNEYGITLSVDDSGHQHKGKGEGGGQFIAISGTVELRERKKDRLVSELTVDGQSVGEVEVLTDLKPIATMENLEIWKEHRKKGYAKELYKKTFDLLQDRGFTEIQSSDNLQETGEAVWKSLKRDLPNIQYKDGVYSLKFNTALSLALYANQVQRACLLEAGDDVAAGMAAAEYILATQPVPKEFATETSFAIDSNTKGQWITIGGKADGKGQMHVGGFHVKVTNDGTIVNGRLKGKKVKDVKNHFDSLPSNSHRDKFTDSLHDASTESLTVAKPSASQTNNEAQKPVKQTSPNQNTQEKTPDVTAEKINDSNNDIDNISLKDFIKLIDKKSTAPSPERWGSVNDAEDLRTFKYNNTTIKFHQGMEKQVASNLLNLLNKLPNKLKDATTSIIFTKQENKDNAHWSKVYSMPGFKAVSTGGAGNITVYGGGTLYEAIYAHESGHNLASKLWGNTTPPPNSEYGIAQQIEKPVSGYGAASPAEDFAEACQWYADQDLTANFRKMFPKKYEAIRKLMEE